MTPAITRSLKQTQALQSKPVCILPAWPILLIIYNVTAHYQPFWLSNRTVPAWHNDVHRETTSSPYSKATLAPSITTDHLNKSCSYSNTLPLKRKYTARLTTGLRLTSSKRRQCVNNFSPCARSPLCRKQILRLRSAMVTWPS